jgi:glycosyltransferase involved in cell wall biosynthesis
MLFRSVYFRLRPLLPRHLRVAVRRRVAQRKQQLVPGPWPIDPRAGRTPKAWPGWPSGKQFAVVLSHDVETGAGVSQCEALANLEETLGFRSSFNFVPEGGYDIPATLRHNLHHRGFEVGVHDLHHDGRLYSSRTAFRRNANRINHYIQEWGASGFRSAFMLHRLEWMHELDIEYDASTFDVDPYEPQPDGATTIFPFWIPATTEKYRPADPNSSAGITAPRGRNGFIELPYTLPQDSTLFVYLGHRDIELWKRKTDWIAEHGGMLLLNLHPDYVEFPDNRGERSTYPPEFYQQLLTYIREKYSGSYWHATPREVALFVRNAYHGEGPRRPQHACMLSYSFFEQDNRVNRYARALAERGDVVDVLSLRPPPKESAPAADNPPPNPSTECTTAPESIDSEIPGVRVHYIQTRRRDEKRLLDFLTRVLGFCWRSARLLKRLQRTHRFDLIHVHNVPDFIIFSTWYPRLKGARLILDLHDLLPEFYQSKFKTSTASLLFRAMVLCERWSCRFADHVIVSNDLWRDKVAARSVPSDRCTAMVNHVDTQAFEFHRAMAATGPAAAPPLDGSPIIAIFPGGWYHHQGLHVAIRAMAALKNRLPQLRLRIVGDGPEREPLAALIQELDLNRTVTLEPAVRLAQIPELLAGAHLGIVPKLAEGFGNEAYSTKIMEFMAAGLPVVASRTRIDEFYFGKGQVHFFRSGDPADMARAIEEVVTRPDLRSNLVLQGEEYVSAHGWPQKSQEYLDLVDRLTAALA